MKKSVQLFLFIILINSCCEKQLNENNNTEHKEINSLIVYKSCPNGSAEIELEINSNGYFSFYMRIYPELQDHKDFTIIDCYGKWFKINNKLRLKFSTTKPIINIIFENKSEYNNEIKIIDENTIEINADSEKIHIWGIRCDKTKNISEDN